MSAVDDIVSYCISKRDGSRHKDNPAHMEKWDRAILACGGTHMDCKHPRRRSLGPMSLDEAESKASTLWGGRNWKPVAAAIKNIAYKVTPPTANETSRQDVRAKGVATQDVSQAEIDSYIILERELKAEIAQYKATITSLKTEVASLKQRPFNTGVFATKIAELKNDNDRLENKVRILEQRPTHLGNDEKLRLGSPEWRHENILRQIDGLPTWSRDEAKKYYNSIGHRQYAEPTHTRKGMFWMDFTTDDNGNVVQTEKPIARYSPKSDVIELQRIINDRDVEINNLLNKVDSNPTAVKVNELEGQIAHLKIQLYEAKDSYVDINNIPFGTAVQVLAKGEFPEPEHRHKIAVKEPDLTTLATYGRMLQNILVDCNRVLPLFGDKKNPSELCKAYNVSISDYGQPIYASKPDDELLNLIEFCRQMDIATDHTIQNLQATKYAVDKVIKEAGK